MTTQRDPQTNVANLISRCIEASPKSIEELAEACGMSSKVLGMVAAGKSKLPLDRIPDVAKALEIDSYDLLEQVFEEYLPETWVIIKAVMPSWLSQYERGVVEGYRKVRGDQDIPVLICQGGAYVEIRPHEGGDGWTMVGPA